MFYIKPFIYIYIYIIVLYIYIYITVFFYLREVKPAKYTVRCPEIPSKGDPKISSKGDPRIHLLKCLLKMPIKM